MDWLVTLIFFIILIALLAQVPIGVWAVVILIFIIMGIFKK